MRPLQATAPSATRSPEANPAPLRPAEEPRTNRIAPDPSPVSVVLRACRPRQWSKNALVLIAPAAAGVIGRPLVQAEVAGAFVSFSLLASATYLFNDVRDRERDRRHPRKRHRPIASGKLAPKRAIRVATGLSVLGLALAALISPALATAGLGYMALTTSYSIWWRHVVFVDLAAVAGGFVLRAMAGGAASGVPLSRSFLAVSAACSLFLVAGKRHAELADGRPSAGTRTTLSRYSRRSLRLVLAGAAGFSLAAYAWWAFARPDPSLWFDLSLLPFILWLARYGTLLGTGAGEAPEELILRDRALLACGAAWVLLFMGGVYVAH